MKTEELRNQVSNILGVRVGKGTFPGAVAELDRQGRIDNRILVKLIVLLYTAIEDFEELE